MFSFVLDGLVWCVVIVVVGTVWFGDSVVVFAYLIVLFSFFISSFEGLGFPVCLFLCCIDWFTGCLLCFVCC